MNHRFGPLFYLKKPVPYQVNAQPRLGGESAAECLGELWGKDKQFGIYCSVQKGPGCPKKIPYPKMVSDRGDDKTLGISANIQSCQGYIVFPSGCKAQIGGAEIGRGNV